MSLNEFDIIKKYFTRQPKQPTVICGVGDDCAVLSPQPDKQLLMSMDTLVSGTHFPENATPYQVATRALCTSLSDLAAMGAKPLWFTLGLSLPSVSESWLKAFSEGLFFIADQYDIDLIGGDTTRGPLTVTIQVHGEVDAQKCLKRDGARVGDAVFVTGCLGDGAAALASLQNNYLVDGEEKDYLVNRFYRPTPQIDAGLLLVGMASSAIDISDGLLADAEHIATASGVSIVVDVEAIPLNSYLLRKDCELDQCMRWALTGGDDYQLLFTVSEKNLSTVRGFCADGSLNATEIGCVVASDFQPDKGVVQCVLAGEDYVLSSTLNNGLMNKGYQHFAS